MEKIMNVSEYVKLGDSLLYVDPVPFASSEFVHMHWVREHSERTVDQIAGMVITKGPEEWCFLRNSHLPVVADVISGIVRRGKLGQ